MLGFKRYGPIVLLALDLIQNHERTISFFFFDAAAKHGLSRFRCRSETVLLMAASLIKLIHPTTIHLQCLVFDVKGGLKSI